MESATTHVDIDYLEATAKLLAREKRLSYERMHLPPGAQVLDVGCGCGIDTVALAGLVGSAGHVTGVDRDPEMVAAADERALLAGLAARITHREGDAAKLPFADGSFDAVRCERFLLFCADPAAIVAQMVHVTRPGGRVVALETDFGTHSVDADARDTRDALLRTLAETILPNGCSGRRVFGLLNRAGLEDVTATPCPLVFTDYDVWRRILIMDVVEREALKTGAVSQDDLDRWHAEMRERAESGTFFASVMLILAAGTKPSIP